MNLMNQQNRFKSDWFNIFEKPHTYMQHSVGLSVFLFATLASNKTKHLPEIHQIQPTTTKATFKFAYYKFNAHFKHQWNNQNGSICNKITRQYE